MAASLSRRYRREQERNSKKLFNKIQQDTLKKISQQPKEKREELMLLYQHMLEQKQLEKENV